MSLLLSLLQIPIDSIGYTLLRPEYGESSGSFHDLKYCLKIVVSVPWAIRSTFVHFGSPFLVRKASADFIAWIRSSLEDSLPIHTKMPLVFPESRM